MDIAELWANEDANEEEEEKRMSEEDLCVGQGMFPSQLQLADQLTQPMRGGRPIQMW